MAKKKIKQKKITKKKVREKQPKKIGLPKGNSFSIPKYIPPPETFLQRIWRLLNQYAFNMKDY
jgi:hypothetical protein